MRLIDADLMAEAEEKAFNKTRCNIDDSFICTVLDMAHDFISRLIASTSTVDAVPVVRCINCIHHEDEEPGMVYCPGFSGGWVRNDFYCADGKRRAENG